MQDSEKLQCFGWNANSLDGINISFVNNIFTSLTEFKDVAGGWREESEKPVILVGVRSSFARKLTIEETLDISGGQF